MSSPTHLPSDHEQMFDLAPASLWLEDYSGIKRLFDAWRAEGVEDLAAMFETHPERLAEVAAAPMVLKVNQRTLQMFGAATQEELVGQLSKVFGDDTLHKFGQEMVQLWTTGSHFSGPSVNYTLSGERLDIEVQARVLAGHEAHWDRVMVSLQDVTAREQATRQLKASEAYAHNLFKFSPVSLWVEDFSGVRALMDEVRERGIEDLRTFINVHPEFVTRCMREIRVVDVNQQTLRMFGAKDRDTLLRQLDKVFRGEMQESFAEQLIDLWKGQTFQQREVVNYSLAGNLMHVHMQFGVLEGHEARWDLVLISLVDITARKKAEAYLEYLGKHDTLTQLRNRTFYIEELNRLSRKGPWPVSVLAIDLNGLKNTNDGNGHAAGDALLRRVGEVLSKAVTEPACAARIGGDEFMVLMPGTDQAGAERLKEHIDSMLELNNQFYPGQPLSLAVGIASCQHAGELELACQTADRAMYEAKAHYYASHQIERRRPVPPAQ